MSQVDINCSILPSGMGGYGEFERKFEEMSQHTDNWDVLKPTKDFEVGSSLAL